MTTFAIIASGVGAQLSVGIILLLGLANVFADALSMGVGEFLSLQAEHQHIFSEKKREEWELLNYPEGERAEMIELYMQQGVSAADARAIIDILFTNQTLLVDVMIREELSLVVPGPGDSPIRESMVITAAFVLMGFSPLIPFAVAVAIDPAQSVTWPLLLATSLTFLLTLLVLGLTKGQAQGQGRFVSSVSILILGVLTSVSAFAVGYFLTLIIF